MAFPSPRLPGDQRVAVLLRPLPAGATGSCWVLRSSGISRERGAAGRRAPALAIAVPPERQAAMNAAGGGRCDPAPWPEVVPRAGTGASRCPPERFTWRLFAYLTWPGIRPQRRSSARSGRRQRRARSTTRERPSSEDPDVPSVGERVRGPLVRLDHRTSGTSVWPRPDHGGVSAVADVDLQSGDRAPPVPEVGDRGRCAESPARPGPDRGTDARRHGRPVSSHVATAARRDPRPARRAAGLERRSGAPGPPAAAGQARTRIWPPCANRTVALPAPSTPTRTSAAPVVPLTVDGAVKPPPGARRRNLQHGRRSRGAPRPPTAVPSSPPAAYLPARLRGWRPSAPESPGASQDGAALAGASAAGARRRASRGAPSIASQPASVRAPSSGNPVAARCFSIRAQPSVLQASNRSLAPTVVGTRARQGKPGWASSPHR